MESFEKPERESGVAVMRKIVGRARESIEKEFLSGAGNSWVACFRTVLTALNGWLYLAKTGGEISSEEYDRAHGKIMELAKEADELHARYPKTGDVPPEEVRERLISRLGDVIG